MDLPALLLLLLGSMYLLPERTSTLSFYGAVIVGLVVLASAWTLVPAMGRLHCSSRGARLARQHTAGLTVVLIVTLSCFGGPFTLGSAVVIVASSIRLLQTLLRELRHPHRS